MHSLFVPGRFNYSSQYEFYTPIDRLRANEIASVLVCSLFDTSFDGLDRQLHHSRIMSRLSIHSTFNELGLQVVVRYSPFHSCSILELQRKDYRFEQMTFVADYSIDASKLLPRMRNQRE